jgi:glycogen synthase
MGGNKPLARSCLGLKALQSCAWGTTPVARSCSGLKTRCARGAEEQS